MKTIKKILLVGLFPIIALTMSSCTDYQDEVDALDVATASLAARHVGDPLAYISFRLGAGESLRGERHRNREGGGRHDQSSSQG